MNSYDTDVLIFIWLEDVNSNEKLDMYQMLVHTFGGKDSPSCVTYAVRRTGSVHGSKFDRTVAACINRSFYMDDVKSVGTEEKC